MNAFFRALLSWGWRVDVLLVLFILATLYVRGWWQLRQKGHLLANGWRLLSYVSGVLIIIVALMSPIDVLGTQLFWVHMVQHLLLVMVAPPLLFLAEPYPMAIWGMPKGTRRAVARLLNKKSTFRNFLAKAGTPGVVWFVYIALLFAWHDPNAYDAALGTEWVHDLEHASFFFIGMLYWWQLLGAAPVFSKRLGTVGRILYAISAVPPNMILGISLAFAKEPAYLHYLSVPRISSLTVLEDLRFGGLIMWVPGGMMYMLVALAFVYKLLQGEDE